MRTAGLVVLAIGGVLIWLAWQGKVGAVMQALVTGTVPSGGAGNGISGPAQTQVTKSVFEPPKPTLKQPATLSLPYLEPSITWGGKP